MAGIPPTTEADDPWEIVRSHEQTAGSAERQARGAFYTPRAVVEAIAAMAITVDGVPDRIVDPTCGAGAFLLGALDRLVELGVDVSDALDRVQGVDIDAGAVDAARSAIAMWAGRHGVRTPSSLHRHIVVGEGQSLAALGSTSFGGYTLVLGNPPFATPLKGAPLPGAAGTFRADRPDRLGPYADLAAVHLAAAVEASRSGDRVVMVLPQSLVSARDVAGLRAVLAVDAPIVDAWASPDRVFDASVRVWAPVLDVGGSPADDRSWAEVLADELGGPVVDLDGEPIGDRIVATAGFRDEYYGLAGACREHEGDGVPADRLATVGSLDPLWSWWGERQTTFAKRGWLRPVIDRAELDDSVARWFDRQRQPKVLVPTQSRTFEPVVDRFGHLVPATPLLSVQIADGAVVDDGGALTLDMVAAMLLSPPLVAWARRRWFGAALSITAIKLPASGLAELPMPTNVSTWREASQLVANAGEVDADQTRTIVEAVGALMLDAYGTGGSDLLEWWTDRLPTVD